jgi:hypothetical protein
MRQVGKDRAEIPEYNRVVCGVDAFGELVQRQSAVTTRGLEDFDCPFTVLVRETRIWRIIGWRRRHAYHCA